MATRKALTNIFVQSNTEILKQLKKDVVKQLLFVGLLITMVCMSAPFFAMADEVKPLAEEGLEAGSGEGINDATEVGDPNSEGEEASLDADSGDIEGALAEGDVGSLFVSAVAGVTPLSNQMFLMAGGVDDAPQYGQISLVKFVKVANGSMGAQALDSSGHVWVWGYSLYGTLGQDTSLMYFGGMKRVPYFAANGIHVVDIGTSYQTRYALGSDGRVYAWGHGANGAMGNGTSTPTNNIPAPVPGLTNVERMFVSDSYQSEASVIVITTTGEVLGWGNNGGALLGLGSAATQTSPVPLMLPAELASREIVTIAVGRTCAFILDDQGDLWGSGADNSGQQGNGTGARANTSFTKMDRSLTGMAPVVDVNIGHSALQNISDHVGCVDENGDVWEWGRTFGDGGGPGIAVDKFTPQKIGFDSAEIAAVGYTPIPQQIEISEMIGIIVDQHGRPWMWGSGYYQGFGLDSGWESRDGGNWTQVPSTGARQYPTQICDGDTQWQDSSPKYPRYLEGQEVNGVMVTQANSKMPDALWGYGFNTLHPTIYDEKYMLKNENGIVLDEEGNCLRLATAATAAGASGLTPGYYYYSDGNGTQNGGAANNNILMPATRGYPATDPDDLVWIRLAFQPIPFVAQMDTSLGAYSLLDADGNIYKWCETGSGNIAWGWDWEQQYDGTPYASSNGNVGLADRYCYEVMYMRGAPTVDHIALTGGTTKKVYVDIDQPVDNPLELTLHMPRSTFNDALDSHVYSDLNQLKWIVLPYDEDDPDFNLQIATLTAERFMELYDAMDDAYKGELLTAPLQSGSSIRDEVITMNVPRNGRLIVYGDNERYVSDNNGASREYVNNDPIFWNTIIDTVYTPINMTHRGEGTTPNGDVEEVYGPTNDTVIKTNDDLADLYYPDRDKDTYGLPLDGKGGLIADPRYGYDSVSLQSYEIAGYPADVNLDFWKWMETINGVPQAKSVEFDLDDVSYLTDYAHTFYYDPINWIPGPSGLKIWVDNENKYNTRPTGITLVLNQYHRDPLTGEIGDFIETVDTLDVFPTPLSQTWAFEFPGWYKSYKYTYRISELDVPFYDSEIAYTNLVISNAKMEDLSGIEITNTLNLKPILFFKVDEDHNVITSDVANFTLTNAISGEKVYDADGNERESVALVTEADGSLPLPLQRPGTYHLTETKAPAGYNLLTMDVVVVIGDDGSITATLGSLPLEEVTLSGANAETYAAAFNIANKEAAGLPMAGGMGTLLLLAVSAAIMLITAFYIKTRKRFEN